MKKLATRRNEFYLSAFLYEVYVLAFLVVRYFARYQEKPWPFCYMFFLFSLLFSFSVLAFFFDGKAKNPCWFHLVIAGICLLWVGFSLFDCFFFSVNDVSSLPFQWGFAGFFAFLFALSMTGFFLTKTSHGAGRIFTASACSILFLVSFLATLAYLFVLARGGSHPLEESMGFVLIAFSIAPAVFGFLSAFQNAKENPRP